MCGRGRGGRRGGPEGWCIAHTLPCADPVPCFMPCPMQVQCLEEALAQAATQARASCAELEERAALEMELREGHAAAMHALETEAARRVGGALAQVEEAREEAEEASFSLQQEHEKCLALVEELRSQLDQKAALLEAKEVELAGMRRV